MYHNVGTRKAPYSTAAKTKLRKSRILRSFYNLSLPHPLPDLPKTCLIWNTYYYVIDRVTEQAIYLHIRSIPLMTAIIQALNINDTQINHCKHYTDQ